jgi:hypothetical protein
MSLAATIGSATFSVAASIPKTILPDNVVRCEPNAACSTETLYGRSYKVLNTPRFTVMVSISNQGNYTRADVSITNHTDTPLSMTPDDFRVEVLTPKPKVLLYVPPANLVLPPPPPSHPAAAAPAVTPQPPAPPAPALIGSGFVSQSPVSPAADTLASPAPSTAETDAVSADTKGKATQEEAERAATEQNLAATSIGPNEQTRGRVYFERDKHAHLVNVVLPIAGLVFEFPYAMKK